MDDAFRRQLESVQATHQAELLRLANEKQKQIEQTNQKVKFSFFYNSPSNLREKVLSQSVFIYDKYGQKPSLALTLLWIMISRCAVSIVDGGNQNSINIVQLELCNQMTF